MYHFPLLPPPLVPHCSVFPLSLIHIYLERCSKERNALETTIFDGIDAQRNDALYRVLAEKLGRAPYKVMYERASQTLNNYAASFKKLGLYEQCQALMAILGLFSTSMSNPSLKIDDKHKCTGLLLTSKNLNNYAGRSLLLIHPSITGVFEQKIDLLGDCLLYTSLAHGD